MESYGKFAQIYDRLMADFDYVKWMNYIEAIFERYGLSPKKILEMACGSGNLTEQLCKKRYQVMAFDLSEEMLMKAQEKIGRRPNVKLMHQNMTSFKYNQKFEVALSICDSINYLTGEGEFKKTVANVFNHLEDNGLFIFDINSAYKLTQIIGENTFVVEESDVFYVWENEINQGVVSFDINFFVKNNAGTYDRFEEIHRERIYEIDEIVQTLLAAGFKKVEVYDAFSFDEAKPSSERLNIVAQK